MSTGVDWGMVGTVPAAEMGAARVPGISGRDGLFLASGRGEGEEVVVEGGGVFRTDGLATVFGGSGGASSATTGP